MRNRAIIATGCNCEATRNGKELAALQCNLFAGLYILRKPKPTNQKVLLVLMFNGSSAGYGTCCSAVLLNDCQLVVQVEMMQLEVDAMQAEAANARAAAEAGQAAVTEVERLGQDNALLAARLAQMDTDLQVLTCASAQKNCPRSGSETW